MNKFKRIEVFPCDRGTLDIIREVETLLGLKSAETDKMSYIELVIILMSYR